MINNSKELDEPRKRIMEQLNILKNMYGIVVSKEGEVAFGRAVLLTSGLEEFASKNKEKFKEVVSKALKDFFSGDLGEFEKYEEDIYSLSRSTIKGRYKLNFKIDTRFGECDTLCVSPSRDGLILHMSMED